MSTLSGFYYNRGVAHCSEQKGLTISEVNLSQEFSVTTKDTFGWKKSLLLFCFDFDFCNKNAILIILGEIVLSGVYTDATFSKFETERLHFTSYAN